MRSRFRIGDLRRPTKESRSVDLVLAIDQGTSGTTALIVDTNGQVQRRAYSEIHVQHPKPGWVEQDAEELVDSVLRTSREVLDGADVAAIGITNQRETFVVFERATLRAVTPAIVWQDRRSEELCVEHRRAGSEAWVKERTGLRLDPYFTATKLQWLLRDNPDLRARAQRGELCAATVDAWLVARLSGGYRIATDASNASRTLLFDIFAGEWSRELCELFEVPMSLLPEVVDSAGRVTLTDPTAFNGEVIPISGIAGDQQASLFGHGCIEPGLSKNTYGTGSFVLVNLGEKPIDPPPGLLTTVAWRIAGRTTYALEGGIFTTGAALMWLRDKLGLIKDFSEISPLFDSVPDRNGCRFVPALVGLGAPFWDRGATGALFGITPEVDRAHVVRAVVESLAYRTRDVVEAMEEAGGVEFLELRVDGGASQISGLCQFQADLLGLPVVRASTPDATALGAAMLAAMGEDLVDAAGVLERLGQGQRFAPTALGERPLEAYAAWRDAVARVRS